MRKAKYGYCALTADFFHIGHLNFIRKCKERCDKLIVGVMSDDCVEEYKKFKPIMREYERMQIIKAIRHVDDVILQDTFGFPHQIMRMKEFHKKDFLIFDSEEHNRKFADVLIPRTKVISTSLYKKVLIESSNYSQLEV